MASETKKTRQRRGWEHNQSDIVEPMSFMYRCGVGGVAVWDRVRLIES